MDGCYVLTFCQCQVETLEFECVERRQAGVSFHQMQENFLPKAKYINWYSSKIASILNPTQAKSTSFVEKVKSKGNLTHGKTEKTKWH